MMNAYDEINLAITNSPKAEYVICGSSVMNELNAHCEFEAGNSKSGITYDGCKGFIQDLPCILDDSFGSKNWKLLFPTTNQPITIYAALTTK